MGWVRSCLTTQICHAPHYISPPWGTRAVWATKATGDTFGILLLPSLANRGASLGISTAKDCSKVRISYSGLMDKIQAKKLHKPLFYLPLQAFEKMNKKSAFTVVVK